MRKTKHIQQLTGSERMLNDLISNLPGVVYRCLNDENWTMLYLSEKCFELTGYNVDDLLGNSVLSYSELIHPEDAEDVEREIQKALSCNEHFELNYRIVTAEEQIKWVWEKGKGIYNINEELIYIEGFITDITDKIETENRYKQLIEFAVDGILIGNKDGIIVEANTFMQNLAGRNLEELKEKHIGTLFLDSEMINKPLRFDLLTKGEAVINELNLVRPDGTLILVEINSKMMPDNRFQAIFRNISNRIKTESLIRESEEKYRNLV